MNIELNNKTILVTGGAGFIGANLCEVLIEKGNKVVCLDNFSTGHKENLLHLSNQTNFTMIEGDVRKLDDCMKATKGVDYVLHQAALGSVPSFLNMLVASRDNGVKRFTYASSSSVYGDSESIPKIEDVIGKPLSPYAITKYVNELYAKIFSRNYGLETIGLRYFNVYGRKQDPNGAYAAVIPKFVSKLMKGESPIVNGDGSYSRDFTYIDDVIQANILSLVTSDKKAINNSYNIAYGERNTLNDLISYIKYFLSKFDSKISNIDVIHGPYRVGDIPHSHACINKAKEYLNYNPQFNLKNGLKAAVKWYWKNL